LRGWGLSEDPLLITILMGIFCNGNLKLFARREKMATKVAWDYTHQEFTITDYYYFSILQKVCEANDIKVDEVTDWNKLADYDVIVFNYPEIPFNEKEVQDIVNLVKQGKRVVILGYYKNEDNIADTVNTLAKAFGL
jgi:hypothetical protein